MKRFLLLVAVVFAAACQTIPAHANPVSFIAPDENNGGAAWSTYDHAGTPIMVEFYFNGCPACSRNHPNVKWLADRHHGKSAQVVELSIDCDADDYVDWIRRYSPTWPVLNGCSREVSRLLGVRAYPTTVVLDGRTHREVYRVVGVMSQAQRQRISTLLRGN